MDFTDEYKEIILYSNQILSMDKNQLKLELKDFNKLLNSLKSYEKYEIFKYSISYVMLNIMDKFSHSSFQHLCNKMSQYKKEAICEMDYVNTLKCIMKKEKRNYSNEYVNLVYLTMVAISKLQNDRYLSFQESCDVQISNINGINYLPASNNDNSFEELKEEIEDSFKVLKKTYLSK